MSKIISLSCTLPGVFNEVLLINTMLFDPLSKWGVSVPGKHEQK